MIKKIIDSLLGNKHKYRSYSSSDYHHRHRSYSSSDYHKRRPSHEYGHHHYKRKHKSHSFFSSS
ncbi:hypothetical protein [Bacillus rhizoplanae]|uniref:hypothetical protein n=1 Tax=Bacillus rhizoplanae TaxID=2880966 RepID=UPI003D1DBB34